MRNYLGQVELCLFCCMGRPSLNVGSTFSWAGHWTVSERETQLSAKQARVSPSSPCFNGMCDVSGARIPTLVSQQRLARA